MYVTERFFQNTHRSSPTLGRDPGYSLSRKTATSRTSLSHPCGRFLSDESSSSCSDSSSSEEEEEEDDDEDYFCADEDDLDDLDARDFAPANVQRRAAICVSLVGV